MFRFDFWNINICHCSVTQSCPGLCSPMDCSMTDCTSTTSWRMLKLKSIESVMPSNHLILCHPLLLLPLIFSSIRVFSNESALRIRWPKYGASASQSVFTMNIQDWFPLELTVLISLQSKTLKSLFQHHSSKASILWCSAFFMVQLSYLCVTTGKTIALNMWTLSAN